MAFFGYSGGQGGTRGGEQEQAERRQAWEELRREGALPGLLLGFGLNMLEGSGTKGFGQAAGGAGLSALNDLRAVMAARNAREEARQRREDELDRQAFRRSMDERRFGLDRERLAWDMARSGAGAEAVRSMPGRTEEAARHGGAEEAPEDAGQSGTPKAPQSGSAGTAPLPALPAGSKTARNPLPRSAAAEMRAGDGEDERERHIRDYAAWIRGGMAGPGPQLPRRHGGAPSCSADE